MNMNALYALRSKLVFGGLLCLSLSTAIAAQPGRVGFPNVAQVTESSTSFTCPFDTSDPGPHQVLSVALETHGRPVLVQFTASVGLASSSIATLSPLIDGQVPNELFVEHNSGANSGITTTLNYSRVHELAPGAHTFGVQFSCQGLQVNLGRRWLTVYELR